MSPCPRCRHDHAPASVAAWLWAVRDAKDKPPPGQLAVLMMMASRMDPATGCGWTRRIDLMADAGVKRDTVTAATVWAIDHGLVRRLATGRRHGDGSVSYSLWTITDPARPESAGFSGTAQGVPENRSQEISRAAQGAPDKSQGRPRVTSRAAQGAPSSKTRDVRPEDLAGSLEASGHLEISRAAQGAPENDGGGEVLTGTVAGALTARDLVAEWIEACPHRPPKRIVSIMSANIKGMLDEPIAYEHVRAGLHLWMAKNRAQPAELHSFVYQAMTSGNGKGTRPAGSDERVAGGMALADHYRRIEQQEGQV